MKDYTIKNTPSINLRPFFAAFAFLLCLLAAQPTNAATITVDSLTDDGAGCTLREAIDNAGNDNNGGGNGCAAQMAITARIQFDRRTR